MSIDYPSDWRVFSNAQSLLLLAAPSPDSESFVDSLSLVAEDLTAHPVTLDQYVAAGTDRLKAAPRLKVIDAGPTTVGGLPARRLAFDAYGETTPYTFEQVVVLRDRRAFVFTFTFGSDQKYRASLPTARRMIASVRFAPPPATRPEVQ